MTDAHCFLFRTIKCQSCLINIKIWSLQDKNDYLLDFIHLVYSPRGIHSHSISNQCHPSWFTFLLRFDIIYKHSLIFLLFYERSGEVLCLRIFFLMWFMSVLIGDSVCQGGNSFMNTGVDYRVGNL